MIKSYSSKMFAFFFKKLVERNWQTNEWEKVAIIGCWNLLFVEMFCACTKIDRPNHMTISFFLLFLSVDCVTFLNYFVTIFVSFNRVFRTFSFLCALFPPFLDWTLQFVYNFFSLATFRLCIKSYEQRV